VPFVGVGNASTSLLQWDKPAIDGPCTIVYNQHWGEQEVTIEADSPTYKDLWHLADKLIRHSGDEHHIYIENFRHNAERNVWELSTGS